MVSLFLYNPLIFTQKYLMPHQSFPLVCMQKPNVLVTINEYKLIICSSTNI